MPTTAELGERLAEQAQVLPRLICGHTPYEEMAFAVLRSQLCSAPRLFLLVHRCAVGLRHQPVREIWHRSTKRFQDLRGPSPVGENPVELLERPPCGSGNRPVPVATVNRRIDRKSV